MQDAQGTYPLRGKLCLHFQTRSASTAVRSRPRGGGSVLAAGLGSGLEYDAVWISVPELL